MNAQQRTIVFEGQFLVPWSPLAPPKAGKLCSWFFVKERGIATSKINAACPIQNEERRTKNAELRTVSVLTSAFSLVEVTLALMVMAIGILSIMSLFPAGLDQNVRSIADTHAAFFAEEVFGGLQAKAETNWADLANVQLPVAASNMWSGMTNVYVTGTNIVTNKYEFNSYVDHALRYRLAVTTNGLLKAVTLSVWPGEFGTTNEPVLFYAEFFGFRP